MVRPSICSKSIIHEIEYDPDARLHCLFVEQDNPKCKPVFSRQFTSNKFSTLDYERLFSLGWNRCGKQFYKVNLERSQIQVYSTRINIDDFKSDKQQKKSNKKFLKFLLELCELEEIKTALGYETNKSIIPTPFSLQDSLFKIIEGAANEILQTHNLIPEDNSKRFKAKKLNLDTSKLKQKVNCGLPTSLFQYIKNNSNTSIDISLPSLEEELVRIVSKLIVNKNLTDFVTVLGENKGFIMFEICKPKDEKSLEYYDLIDQACQDFKTNINIQNLVRSQYKLVVRPAVYTEEAFKLFEKYQSDIHKCKATTEEKRQAFINNLCLSPLFDVKNHCEADNFFYNIEELDKLRADYKLNEYPIYQGTYHLHHLLKGKLIAISVVDILPETFYSSYFFYDPNYKNLELGKVSVQYEVEYAKNLRKEEPTIKYYSLGLYSKECEKNKYKLEFHPSQVLCPYTCQWVLMSKDIQEILVQKSLMSKLVMNTPDIPESLLFNVDSLKEETNNLNVMILNLEGEIKKYQNIDKSESSFDKLRSLVFHVGKEVSRNIIIIID